MSETTKKELEINVKQITRELQCVVDGGIPTEDLTKAHFEGIRMLVDHCEQLALSTRSFENN